MPLTIVSATRHYGARSRPRSRAASYPEKRSCLMQPRASKRPVVLIVEDETLVRMEAIDAIETAGFDVVEAANADQAVAILEQRSDIRLIFTDIHMPGAMDGLKLAHFVKDRWPPIKIIATSGRAENHGETVARRQSVSAQTVYGCGDRERD